MCRLLIVTGAMRRTDVLGLIAETAKKFRPSQRDGFGFVAFNAEGVRTAYGRYYDEYVGWRSTKAHGVDVIEKGELSGITTTLIIHGRTSTNVQGVNYCHPYKQNSTYLAHNGVLSWTGRKSEEPKHKNDSGAFLKWLESTEHPVPEKWADFWSGYGALAIMREKHNLQIVKCSNARLSMALRRSTEGYIFATVAQDIPRRLIKGVPRYMHPGTLELDKTTGALLKIRPFKGFKKRVWDEMATRSLGARPLGAQPQSPTSELTYTWDEDRDVREDPRDRNDKKWRVVTAQDYWKARQLSLLDDLDDSDLPM